MEKKQENQTTENIKVVFTPSGKRGEVAAGTTVLSAARKLGVDLDSVCGGRGICGRCQVEPSWGEFAKFSIHAVDNNLSPFSQTEERYQSKRGLKTKRRLGCSTKLLGDMVIDIPAESQVHQQVIRKRAEVRDIIIDPVIRLYYIAVEEPDMDHPSGDFERVNDALLQQWNVNICTASMPVLEHLQTLLRKSDWKITVAVRDDKIIVAAWEGLKERFLGAAVDIGSTTMSVHLCDMRTGEVLHSVGIMNPQIRFGEDLMSRVSYIMMNPDGNIELTRSVRHALVSLLEQVCAQITEDPNDVLEVVFVGNPIMHHLLLGWNPVELGWAPFALVSNASQDIDAAQLELTCIHPSAHAWTFPLIAGHVGADAAAVILSESPQTQEAVSLIIDVGTNAEIVLGNKDQLLACSSPTGPAFEGAQISSGQRAGAGAIERVRVDPQSLEPRYKIIGCDLWSDHPDFPASAAKIGITGICGSGIIEVLAEMFLAGIIDEDGCIGNHLNKDTNRIVKDGRTWSYILYQDNSESENPTIKITQNDVRAIQLAKAALYAGAMLLVDKLGKKPDRIILAGAFGSHIDTKYAMVLGMIPDCNLKNVWSVGNAAGTGARIALLNHAARQEICTIVKDIEKIETATEEKFQAYFVDAMAFPHKTDPFTNLRATIDIPNIKPSVNADSQHRARRRNRGR